MGFTPYSILYDSVLSKIKDYDWATLTADEVYEILIDYVRPAVIKFTSCKKDLSDRDDELQQFNFELTDVEIEILCLFMLIEYIDSNYIRVPDKLKNTLTSKDFIAFSGANHLTTIKSTRQMYYNEVSQLMRDYSYKDSLLFENKR